MRSVDWAGVPECPLSAATLDGCGGASDNGAMTLHIPRLPFALDPLIAEAKRRARQRRVLVALIAVVVVAAGAVLTVELRGQGSVAPVPAVPVPANLTVLVVGESWPGRGALAPDNGGRALFHLKCDPAGGDVADPAKACAAIAAQPSLVTNPKPYYTSGQVNSGSVTAFRGFGMPAGGQPMQVCHFHPVKLCPFETPWYFRITGSVNGKPVHFGGSGEWGTQVALVDKLGLAGRYGKPLRLEPRRHGFVAMNETHRFAPGVLRPGDLVTCRVGHRYKGLPLAMSVPAHRGFGPKEASAGPGLMAIRIRADGTVLASCFARDRMPLSKRGRTTDPQNWPPKSLR